MTTRFTSPRCARKLRRRPSLEALESRQVLSITLSPIGGYDTDIFDDAAVEIIAYHAVTKRVFTADQSAFGDPDGDGPLPAKHGRVGVVDVKDPTNPTLKFSFDVSAYGLPTSIATHGNFVAVAIPNGADETLPGVVAFFLATAPHDLGPLNVVMVGSVPDHVVFTPDGRKVLTANEGQPCGLADAADCFEADPEGSVSIIDLSRGVPRATVSTASFASFNDRREELLADGVRLVTGPTVAQNLEPEYIAVSPNSQVAWVTLQENNALAEVDLQTGHVTKISAFGYKDHSLPGNALDPNDGGGNTPTDPNARAIGIANWPVRGLYQPDGITVFSDGTSLYLATANEGDTFAGESVRVGQKNAMGNYVLDLNDTAFPNEAALKLNAQLGRLNVSQFIGDEDGDGDFDALYAFGGRSFSIWTPDANLVFDSGDDFEQITAAAYPANFNASNTVNTLDNRSDDKGPEPTTVVVGEVEGRKYAFTTIERTGGVMVYDVTTPSAPTFVQYINTRNFAETPGPGTGGDLHPEGLVFVPASSSPNGKNLLIAGFQVSGSFRIFQIDTAAPASPAAVVATATVGARHTLAEQTDTRLAAQASRRVQSIEPRVAATDRVFDSAAQSLSALRHRGRAGYRATAAAVLAADRVLSTALPSV